MLLAFLDFQLYRVQGIVEWSMNAIPTDIRNVRKIISNRLKIILDILIDFLLILREFIHKTCYKLFINSVIGVIMNLSFYIIFAI